MDTLLQDLRFGLRSLRKGPLLSLAALACVAIGVGATVSVVTLVNTTLVQNLPYPEADRLVRVWGTNGPDEPRRDVSYPNYLDLREADSLERLEAAARTRLSVVDDTGVERVRGESVTPGYFDLIGVRPAFGRTFGAPEYDPGAADLVLIGHGLWQRRFGGDPGVVGKTLLARGSWGGEEVTNRPYQVIGVMPEGFTGTIEDDESEFWLPIAHYEPRANLELRQLRVLWTLGPLAEGATVSADDPEVGAVGSALAAQHPDVNEGFGARVERLGENWREGLRGGMWLLLAASFLLLLIACTNIANLLLARLARRRHELTVRLVMGARRTRVLRQLLTESLVLALVGGALGVGLAWLFVDVYMELAATDVPAYVDVAVDWRVVALSVLLVAVTGVLFGVVPAWLGSRTDTAGELKEDGGRGTSAGRRQKRFGQLLIAAEVALTLVLLLAASLMFRSYRNLETEDLGYDVENMMRLSTTLDLNTYPAPEDWGRLRREAKAAIAAYPGVLEVASVGGVLPPVREPEMAITFPARAGEELDDVSRHLVDDDFLDTLDIELLHGRNFDGERADGPRVALISESLARVVGGGEARDALGQPLQMLVPTNPPQLSQPYEVVGVVEDTLYDGPLSERPHDFDLFLSIEQVQDYLISYAVRTAGPPERYLDPLTRVVSPLVTPSPVHWVQVVREMIAERYSDTRFYTMLTGVYSLAAVLLAVIGIYGVLANSVSRRVRELGIRVAVGAQGGHLLRMVIVQSMATVVVGLAIGLAVALAGTRVMGSLLYGVTASDPGTYVLVVAGLLLLALFASWLPARRATRIDPVVALRNE